jgi:hypothetical protein
MRNKYYRWKFCASSSNLASACTYWPDDIVCSSWTNSANGEVSFLSDRLSSPLEIDPWLSVCSKIITSLRERWMDTIYLFSEASGRDNFSGQKWSEGLCSPDIEEKGRNFFVIKEISIWAEIWTGFACEMTRYGTHRNLLKKHFCCRCATHRNYEKIKMWGKRRYTNLSNRITYKPARIQRSRTFWVHRLSLGISVSWES